jgi:hypothetical protein
MVVESHELEPWKEKLLGRGSLDDSFSDAETHHEDSDEDEEDDIVVHGSDDGPSSEDRDLLNEEDEREKLLTRRRNKVLIGRHARRKSIESAMEDGTLSRVASKVLRSASSVNPRIPCICP